MSPIRIFAATLLLSAGIPAAAQQQSESYKFLEAVRNANGNDVIAFLDRPGSQIVNTRSPENGQGALYIVAKRGDLTYMRYLLQKGADPNIRDDNGTTPLMIAAEQGQADMAAVLIEDKANVDLANAAGETPLIRAVQRRDLPMVRQLLAAGADPDISDNLAGLSARDYATRDSRNTAVAKLIADTPKKTRRDVAGPKF